MRERIDFSVVTPVYNEEKLIYENLGKIIAYFKKANISCEIIVVDDGSKDNTVKLVREFSNSNEEVVLLRNKKNLGKGLSIKRGVLCARGKYILFTDIDLAVPIEGLSKFMPYLKDGYDIVIGSRRIEGSQIIIPQPLYRRFMGSVFYKIVNLLFFKFVRDVNCGFKCYHSEAAKKIFTKQMLSGWGFDTELLHIAYKLKMSIKEIPVCWSEAGNSKVVIHKAVFGTLGELLKIKINDWKGWYSR